MTTDSVQKATQVLLTA